MCTYWACARVLCVSVCGACSWGFREACISNCTDFSLSPSCASSPFVGRLKYGCGWLTPYAIAFYCINVCVCHGVGDAVRWDWVGNFSNLSRFNKKCLSADLCKRIFCSLVQFVCSASPSSAFHLKHWRLSTKLHQLVLKCIIYGFELGYFFLCR